MWELIYADTMAHKKLSDFLNLPQNYGNKTKWKQIEDALYQQETDAFSIKCTLKIKVTSVTFYIMLLSPIP